MDFNFVTPRLATGAHLTGPVDVAVLVAAGITHVIDATDEEDDTKYLSAQPELTVLWNPTPDDGTKKPDSWFQSSLDFGQMALSKPKTRLYAHCSAGVNRGPSTCYLVLRAYGIPADIARQLIVQARPVVQIAYADQADDFLQRLIF